MNRTKLSATPEGDVSTHDDSSVTMGAERFDQYLPTLEGQRVAVMSNQTGYGG